MPKALSKKSSFFIDVYLMVVLSVMMCKQIVSTTVNNTCPAQLQTAFCYYQSILCLCGIFRALICYYKIIQFNPLTSRHGLYLVPFIKQSRICLEEMPFFYLRKFAALTSV